MEIPKLTAKEYRILDLLTTRGEMFGLQLVEAAPDVLSRGAVYVYLHRMEEKGFVASRKAEDDTSGGAARRMYRPTGLGQRALRAAQAWTAAAHGEVSWAL